jgi:small subunit ribosomal protein S16
MAVKIRLLRQGSKKRPNYLIVAMDREKRRDGEYLEKIGFYYPKKQKPSEKILLNKDILKKWMDQGAELTLTVKELVRLA